MDTPKKQQFAFNNIQMNMSKSDVEKTLNKPKRVTFNEYGTKWYTYYDGDYNNFIMVSYIKDKVNALYTNQNGAPSKSLADSFELQNFDLVNAERKQHQLSTLKYSKQNSETARKHSKDMAKNHYFDHTNLKGQSPFDRLKKDGIAFNSAGENLAYGQVSSIYAHQGLMNSIGHRKNILNDTFKILGVGVDFNDEKQPFWTENYTD